MTENNIPCYIGCFYYTDSCFRDDCKKCKSCGSIGFDKSIIEGKCTFCDGTEGGNPPDKNDN